MGDNCQAKGKHSVAMGYKSETNGTGNLALGNASKTYSEYSYAIGNWASANGQYSVSIGSGTKTSGYAIMALGYNNDTIPTASYTAWVETDPLLYIGNGTSGTSRRNALTILKNGNTGIGTNSPTQKLDVNGNARFRSIGSGTYAWPVNITSDGTLTTATSDIRIKENIQTLRNSLDKVLKLRGVSFTWKTEPEMGTRIGMIAQEVEKVIPELVFVNNVDGYKGINYAEMSAVLVEAIKEQQQQIEAEKAKNKELENELITLKERLSALEAMMGKK